jgi:hypothetical protein
MAARGLTEALHALKGVPGYNSAAQVEQPYRRRSDEFSQPHSINPLSDRHFGVLAVENSDGQRSAKNVAAQREIFHLS